MQFLRLLWAWMLTIVSCAVQADEVFQKVTSLDEINETDSYIICSESVSGAIYKTSGNFLGVCSFTARQVKGDYIEIDPDRTGTNETVPDVFRLIRVRNGVYAIQYVADGDLLSYERSNNNLHKDILGTSDDRAQWRFKTYENGVYVNCASRADYFISLYKGKFGVYKKYKDWHDKTLLYKRIGTRAKRVVVGNARYVSYASPDKVGLTLPQGLRAYVVDQAYPDRVRLKEIGAIPANTAVLLSGEPGTYLMPYATQAVNTVGENLLMTSDGKVVGDLRTIYSLGQVEGTVGFYLVDSSVKIPEGKAYLKIETATAAKCLMMWHDENAGITTAVQQTEQEAHDMRYYDLCGQRIRFPQRGVVIRDRRKYKVK